MGFTQRFQLYQAPGSFGAEYVCAGCQAPMTAGEPAEGGQAGELVMTHGENCPETSDRAGASTRV